MGQTNFNHPLDLKGVHITDGFWHTIQETVRREVLPCQWRALNDQVEGAEPSWCIHNFKAAAYSLLQHPDPQLERTVDEAVELICAAQDDSGYLDTYYLLGGMDRRFTNLREDAEDGPLYTDYAPGKTRPVTLRLIPYFAWANRGEGEMRV